MRILSMILVIFSFSLASAGTSSGCSHDTWDSPYYEGAGDGNGLNFASVYFSVQEDSKYKWFFFVSGNQENGCGDVSGTNQTKRASGFKGAEIENEICHFSFDPYKGDLEVTSVGNNSCQCAGTIKNMYFSACHGEEGDKFEKVEKTLEDLENE